jgi:hypothetical protein
MQPAPRADAQPASREAWLAFLLAGLVLLVQGWFLPLLGFALLARPTAGLVLAGRDAWRQRRSATSPG